jgi:H+/gluconate symporter-like permease
MKIAALIYLIYALLTIGVAYGSDGQQRKIEFSNVLGKEMLIILILIWGGFFNGTLSPV